MRCAPLVLAGSVAALVAMPTARAITGASGGQSVIGKIARRQAQRAAVAVARVKLHGLMSLRPQLARIADFARTQQVTPRMSVAPAPPGRRLLTDAERAAVVARGGIRVPRIVRAYLADVARWEAQKMKGRAELAREQDHVGALADGVSGQVYRRDFEAQGRFRDPQFGAEHEAADTHARWWRGIAARLSEP